MARFKLTSGSEDRDIGKAVLEDLADNSGCLSFDLVEYFHRFNGTEDISSVHFATKRHKGL